MPQSVDRDDVRQLVEERDAIVAVVLPRAEYEWAHPEGVVLGRLDMQAADADDTTVDTLMREGPTTVRPREDLHALTEHMQGADVDAVLATRSDGTLLGLLERDTAESTPKEADDVDR